MRVLWICPLNIHLEPILSGLSTIRAVETVIHWIDQHGFPCDRPILDAVDRERPDLIVYTGANGGLYVPTTETLLRLRDYAPTIFMCHDASDKTWAPYLEEYMARDVFTSIVSIDGNREWKRRPQDITALTPHDPRFYQ